MQDISQKEWQTGVVIGTVTLSVFCMCCCFLYFKTRQRSQPTIHPLPSIDLSELEFTTRYNTPDSSSRTKSSFFFSPNRRRSSTIEGKSRKSSLASQEALEQSKHDLADSLSSFGPCRPPNPNEPSDLENPGIYAGPNVTWNSYEEESEPKQLSC